MERLGGAPGWPAALKATVPTPETTAVTVFGPGAGPRVQTVEASPSCPVDTFCGWTLPPPAVTSQVTPSPATGLPPESRTRTTSGSATEVPTTADCPSPETRSTVAAAPGSAVCVKVTGDPASPGAAAVVCWTPAVGASVT